MKKLLGLAGSAILYICVATILAQLIGLGFLAGTGRLTDEKRFQIFAVLHGVDMVAMAEAKLAQEGTDDAENVSSEQRSQYRLIQNLQLDKRQQFLDMGLEQLNSRLNALIIQQNRYDDTKEQFDERLEKLQGVTTDDAILDLVRLFEGQKPDKSKDLLVDMLPTDFGKANQNLDAYSPEERERIISVVTILKTMADDKQKKIVGQFDKQVPDDFAKITEIIELIRKGVPLTTLIEDTKENMSNDFNQNSQP